MKVSVSGKGGSGKSTVVSLLAKEAVARGYRVLVVDSDESNSGLFRMLGFEVPPESLMDMLGGKKGLREKMKNPTILAKEKITLDAIPAEHVVKNNGLMLVGIGKVLHALEGCACPMGVLNREFLKKVDTGDNDLVFADTEAGIEHFGRGMEDSVDSVLVVVEPSFESITLAEKITELTKEMNKKSGAVLNKIGSDAVASKMRQELKKRNVNVIATIPDDQSVFEAGLEGQAVQVGATSSQVGKLLDYLLE